MALSTFCCLSVPSLRALSLVFGTSFLPFLLFSPTSLLSFVETAVSSSCLKETAIFFFFFALKGAIFCTAAKQLALKLLCSRV